MTPAPVVRYMSPDTDARIVAHVFTPAEPVEPYDLTADSLGTATLTTREQPGLAWDEPRAIAPGLVAYGDWLLVCDGQGFHWDGEL